MMKIVAHIMLHHMTGWLFFNVFTGYEGSGCDLVWGTKPRIYL